MKVNKDEILPRVEKVLTTDGLKDGCYILVVNRKNKDYGPILRHIITDTYSNTLEEFKQWYYSMYTELRGDEFIVCATREERDRVMKKLNEEE